MLEWWDDVSTPGAPMPAEGALGKALRAARDRAVISQKELAARAGTSQSAVSRLERGHRESWPVFCQLVDAMGLEPVIHTRRKTSELAAEVERLATMSVAERLAQRYLFLDWLSTSMSESLPQAGWAMDGDAALLAHGVPAAPDRFQIAIVDDPEVIAACDRLRESPTNDSEFRLVSELPPTAMVVPAGEHLVPILPLDAIERGPEGSPERLEREAAIAAYLEHLSG